MNARRLIFATVGSVCVLVCMLVVGIVPALAAAVRFAPGQVGEAPVGVAVDQASGNVYVADGHEGQVNVFDGSGSLSTSFGKALFGQEPGRNGDPGPAGVAVDNELSSLSYGDVYVVDWDNHRVDKFTASGEFLLMFGGGVNEKTGGDVCIAGEACVTGTTGTADGQFEFAFRKSYIAVGPDGRVYVGDRARVQVFEPSGVWRENISLSGLSSTGEVTALAVDSSGDVFVKIGDDSASLGNPEGAVAGVREFEPDGMEKSVQFDAGSELVEAIALDESGDVFVADSSGGGRVLEYDSAGILLEDVGASTATTTVGLAYSDVSGDLYVSGYRGYPGASGEEREDGVWVLAPPVPGPPTIETGSVSAVPAPRGKASIAAKFNPGDFETTYHFEYVDEAEFQASGYANALSTPDASVGPSLEEQSVSVALTGLVGGATYHYRLVATSSKGTATSPDQSFQETPSALIVGPWVTNVASTSATFDAEVDPLAASTEYRFEYGTSASYGQVVSGSVGEGEGYVAIGFHNQELAPSTVYHYRLVTSNKFGTVEGADHTFTTQVAGVASTLPDGRAWELVSPPNKKGALIGPVGGVEDQLQAADDGSGVTYIAEGPHVGEDPIGNTVGSQILSRRGSGGWGSVDITLPSVLPETGEGATELAEGNPDTYPLFSSDLSLALVEPAPFGTPLLSSEASERTLYLRDSASGSFLPLVTRANVPAGTNIEEPTFMSSAGLAAVFQMHFLGGTPDLSHVVFKTPLALTPGAIDEENVQKNSGNETLWNLYEWGEGKLRLVNILPGNEGVAYGPARLAGMTNGGGSVDGSAERSMSSDGRRIAWTLGEPYGAKGLASYQGLYVRDMVEEKTVRVGGASAVFQTMSSDGSKIFYLENGDLYEFDFETGTQTDLTGTHGPGEDSAGVQESVSDVSEDGSYVYFVATGVLANGGVAGEDNLYLSHDTSSGWTTTYVATLSSEDEKSWYGQEGFGGSPDLASVSSRVSPNGHYLAFMSDRSLTGYDNVDALSGAPDEEVYLYDAQTGKLVCASCNPTGARPVGVLDDPNQDGGDLLVDFAGVWGASGDYHWLAGSVPGWDGLGAGRATYQPRYLSDGGRLFFDSPDALVPQDTNGLEDVYEYEPPANTETAGSDDCTTVSATFSERSDGCVNLISSGTSSAESVFYDASEDGDDVFFATTSKLVGEDYDKGYDVYDAHACSESVPCAPVPVSPPPCTSGDSCKAAPSPQPEIFGPTPSATFKGVGNVMASPAGSVVAPKALTRAQKLARALNTCHKKKKAKTRRACERQARTLYAARRSGKAKATGKGKR